MRPPQIRAGVNALIGLVVDKPEIYGFIVRSMRSGDHGILDNTLVRTLHAGRDPHHVARTGRGPRHDRGHDPWHVRIHLRDGRSHGRSSAGRRRRSWSTPSSPSSSGASTPSAGPPWTPHSTSPRTCPRFRGGEGTRTLDLRLAKPPLFQLSYTPNITRTSCATGLPGSAEHVIVERRPSDPRPCPAPIGGAPALSGRRWPPVWCADGCTHIPRHGAPGRRTPLAHAGRAAADDARATSSSAGAGSAPRWSRSRPHRDDPPCGRRGSTSPTRRPTPSSSGR